MTNLASLLDANRWSGYQMLIVLLASLAILFDGFDNQALGLALPAILADWQLPKAALGPALAASQFGMMTGAIAGGFLGDRLGRKFALVGSVLLFGAATLLISWSASVLVLATLRFVAGIGLGAAFPNVAAIAAECTPARHRGLAVTMGIVSVPLGGTIGGMVAAWILPAHGWRALFVLAGMLTLVLALLLVLLLPESVAFLLTRKPVDARRIERLCRRMGIAVPAAEAPVGTTAPAQTGAAILLSRPFIADTIWLWAAFFFCLASIYAAFGWLPTLLVSSGHDLATASAGLAAFNFGGVVVALFTGWLIGRMGSRRPMLALASIAVIVAALLALFPAELTATRAALLCALAIEGACVNGVQTTLYALAAHAYPSSARATGIGAATFVGRSGAILSLMLGGVAIMSGGPPVFHAIIAGSMLVVALALGLIGRHQAPATRPAG
jgi:AAHS family 4-hydroxybenzoate transporter-like MFS transporter